MPQTYAIRFPRAHARSGCRPAFTLIELLIVIAIIAVLISILLPALAGARENGRTVQCLSNHRQIAHAMAGYLEQFDEWLPRETGQMSDPLAYYPWPMAFRPLLDDRVYWKGLDERNRPQTNMNDHYYEAPYYKCPAYPTKDTHQVQYANNGISFTKRNGVLRYAGHKPITKFHVIPNPSEIIYLTAFGDEEYGDLFRQLYRPGATNYSIGILYDIREPSNFSDARAHRLAWDRHPVGSNTMYMDGHATPRRWYEVRDFESWFDNDERFNQGSAYWRTRQ